MFEKLKGRLSGEDLDSLRELYVNELHDLASAERQIIDALPEIAEDVHDPALHALLDEQLATRQTQLERFNAILSDLGEEEEGSACLAMEGLLKEARLRLGIPGNPLVKDAAIIAAMQRIVNHEVVAISTALDYSELLGEIRARELLEQTLYEEENTDTLLTDIAIDELTAAPRRKAKT